MAAFLGTIWQILLEMAPWLLLGALMSGVLEIILPASFLRRQLQGRLGIWKAVGLGVPLPLCSCAVIPVGLGLRQGGASRGATLAFLVSTPQTGVDSILVCAAFLGWPFAAFKVVAAVVMGILAGWYSDRNEHEFSLPVVTAQQSHEHQKQAAWHRLLRHSLEMLRSIWGWLVIGIVASAMITMLFPTGALANFGTGGRFLAMIATLVIAVPFYVCATASIPIAAALVGSGLPIGAALVFLIAGPATNVATIGAVSQALGRRALSVYLTVVIIGSILFGWLVSLLLKPSAVSQIAQHTHAGWLPTACAATLIALLCYFVCESLFARKNSTAEPSASDKN